MARKRSLPAGAGAADPAEDVRENILQAATEAFAEQGFAGARVDDIAARTATSKRMLYYYFEDKDTLYRAVLVRAYEGIRAAEAALHLDELPPLVALRRLVEATFDYHADHPEMVRLVMDENMRRGAQGGGGAAQTNAPAIAGLAALLRRGRATGEFRSGIAPTELHLVISALCFYPVSNRHTFAANYALDSAEPKRRTALRRRAIEAVVGLCKA